jgi:chromosome segregation ATPase
LRGDREADAAARLRDEFAVAKLQEQQAVSREAVMMERNEKLQGELHIVQGRLREVEQQFGEQQTLMMLQQTQQQQHQQQQQHHTDELKNLRMQRDAWEAEVRHSKSVVSDLVATNARLQVRRLKILFDLSLPSAGSS